MRSHQHVCALQSIVHLDASDNVPLAFHNCSFNHPGHCHDRGATARERQYRMGMQQRRPVMDCIRCIRYQCLGVLAQWLLYSRVRESQYRLHHFATGGYCLPDLHVFFDLAILEAVGALPKYARTVPWRILQGLSAWYYPLDFGHPLSSIWPPLFLRIQTFLMIPFHVRYDTHDSPFDDPLAFTMTYYLMTSFPCSCDTFTFQERNIHAMDMGGRTHHPDACAFLPQRMSH